NVENTLQSHEQPSFQPAVTPRHCPHKKWIRTVSTGRCHDGMAGLEYATGRLDPVQELTTLQARWYMEGGPKGPRPGSRRAPQGPLHPRPRIRPGHHRGAGPWREEQQVTDFTHQARTTLAKAV
ncbi:hypothetical protein ACFWB8_34465, partial [Streptomyces sp. NPDC060031]